MAVGLEIGDAFAKRGRDLLEADRAEPIDTLFIFLDLLERDSQLVA